MSVQPSAYTYRPVWTDQREPDAAVVVVAWVLTAVSGGYLLPWAIAATRGKANQGAVGLIAFLLGWTVIGWIVALVMACQQHRYVGPPPPGWYPATDAPGQRYWDGAAWTDHRAP